MIHFACVCVEHPSLKNILFLVTYIHYVKEQGFKVKGKNIIFKSELFEYIIFFQMFVFENILILT